MDDAFDRYAEEAIEYFYSKYFDRRVFHIEHKRSTGRPGQGVSLFTGAPSGWGSKD